MFSESESLDLGNASSIVFAGIAPHPPIMVPEVGHDAIAQVLGSINAMARFTERIITCGAETVVLVSPHAPLERDAFVAYQGPELYGDFAAFRARETRIAAQLDEELLQAIRCEAQVAGYAVSRIRGGASMDHGINVPLYFLQQNGWRGGVIALGYSFLSNDDHLSFGACIKRAAGKVGRPIAIVASGDLSHRLKPEAPAGYDKRAHFFDEEIIGALRANSPERIVDVDQDLRALAGECGYRSMLVAIGAMREATAVCEVLSYEAPFGVGYLVAQLLAAPVNGRVLSEPSALADGSAQTTHPVIGPDNLEDLLPALARSAVETFVIEQSQIRPPYLSESLSARAACFVSIKTNSGDLRGCVGTVEPVYTTLGQEVIVNAIHAASRDPRFQPVSVAELPQLRYSVDVLSSPEPTTFAELDPITYGVIVEDESGRRRGLLLPDIESVDTAAQQVEIAARKAGIPFGAPVRLSRFQVQRYRED